MEEALSSNSHQKVPLFGLGIAGNFAGHLQQTGEANALQGAVDASRPQALFPFLCQMPRNLILLLIRTRLILYYYHRM